MATSKTPKTLKLSIPSVKSVLRKAGHAEAEKDFLGYTKSDGFDLAGFGFKDYLGGRVTVSFHAATKRTYRPATQAEQDEWRAKYSAAVPAYEAALLAAGYHVERKPLEYNRDLYALQVTLPWTEEEKAQKLADHLHQMRLREAAALARFNAIHGKR